MNTKHSSMKHNVSDFQEDQWKTTETNSFTQKKILKQNLMDFLNNHFDIDEGPRKKEEQ